MAIVSAPASRRHTRSHHAQAHSWNPPSAASCPMNHSSVSSYAPRPAPNPLHPIPPTSSDPKSSGRHLGTQLSMTRLGTGPSSGISSSGSSAFDSESSISGSDLSSRALSTASSSGASLGHTPMKSHPVTGILRSPIGPAHIIAPNTRRRATVDDRQAFKRGLGTRNAVCHPEALETADSMKSDSGSPGGGLYSPSGGVSVQ